MATEGVQLHDGGNVVAAANLYNPGSALPGPNGSGQFCAVVISAARTVNIAGAGVQMYGILQNTPVQGDPADVCLAGITKAVGGAAIAAGAQLMIDSSGRLVTATTGNQVVGQAIEANAAANDLFTALIWPGGWPHA